MPLCSDLLYFDLKIYLKMANGMHVLAMQNAMHEVSWEWNKREWQLPAFVTIQFQQRFPRLILRFYLGGFSLALLRSLPRRSDKKLYTKNNFFFLARSGCGTKPRGQTWVRCRKKSSKANITNKFLDSVWMLRIKIEL